MSDSIERAIVEFVIQGAGTAEQASDRVGVKLESVERAGKSAERAANDSAVAAERADQAARQLVSSMTHALGRLHTVASLAQKAANIAGFDQDSNVGQAIGIVGSGLSSASQGVSIGASIGSAIPVLGTALGGAIGGGIGAAIGVVNGIQDLESRVERAAQRGATRANTDRSVEDVLLREAVSARYGFSRGGGEIR